MDGIFVLALLAAMNPTLVAATTVMLMLPSPRALMLGYLCGALLTSITLGVAIVFSFGSTSDTTSAAQNTANPVLDLTLGALALVISATLAKGRLHRPHRKNQKEKKDKGPPRWQQALSKGTPRTTFLVGMVLTLPGASYLAGLHRIHEQGYAKAGEVAVVVAFNLVMLLLLEVPLVCFTVAPDWTPGAVERARAWVTRHLQTILVRGAAALGVALVIKGTVGLIA